LERKTSLRDTRVNVAISSADSHGTVNRLVVVRHVALAGVGVGMPSGRHYLSV
jgi:soluble P-type ATPase